MADIVPLDKFIVEGTTYETTARTGLVIKAYGTDSTSAGYLEIDGRKTGEIFDTVAPLYKRTTNLLGPLQLETFYYVIPPETKFKWIGASGSECRLIGDLWILAPGEALPGDLMTRYGEQFNRYLTHEEGTYALGTDEPWPAGQSYSLIDITPLTIERLMFAYPVMVSVTGDTITERQVAISFWLNGNPVEYYTPTDMYSGIDILSCPRPPAEGTEMVPFSLAQKPISVPGDTRFEARLTNVSGAALTPATGAAWSMIVTAICEYEKRVG